MSELPEKQIKRLRSLLTEAETNLSAAKELLTSMLGDGDIITALFQAWDKSAQPTIELKN